MAAVRLDDGAGDEESQARAADIHGPLVEEAGELVEQLWQVLLPDADALVVDGDFGVPVLVWEGDHGDVAPAR